MDPIIANEDNIVNTINASSDSDITIERCPHDAENPYTMVRNELIRDNSISPQCRWLIIYLLSNKEGWKINVRQLVNHLKEHMGRTQVYKLFEEAIEAGYMKREAIFSKTKNGGNIKSGFKYFVSETPKFKESLRHSKNRYTGDRQAVKPDYKNKQDSKKEHVEEENTPPIPPQTPDLPKKANAVAEATMPAEAGEVKKDLSSKPKREKPEFSTKVRDVGQQLLGILAQHEPDYSPPKNLAPFLTEVDFMLRLDKRDPQKVADILSWALSDSFWRDKMFKPNPAKYLREKFLQLKNKMEAAPQTNPHQVDRRLKDKEGKATIDSYKDNLF